MKCVEADVLRISSWILFEHQDKLRQEKPNTKLLVVYFVIAVALHHRVGLSGPLLIFAGANAKQQPGEPPPTGPVESQAFPRRRARHARRHRLSAASTKPAALAKGGSAVAESLGGRLVNPNTTDPDERKLLNVVEEMAIASGVPVPQVYVLDDEQGINAFAAGHTPSDAAIAVTRGCMTMLTRDELQGVIGHEFSHILNGDMRLNLRLMGIIFGILCLAVIGRILLYTRSGSSRDKIRCRCSAWR